MHRGDQHHDTPLMAAVVQNNPAMVTILLNAGSCPHRPNFDGHNALDMAVWKGNAGIIRVFGEYGTNMSAKSDGFTPLLSLAQLGHTDSIVEILKFVSAASINFAGDVGQTALILACAENHADTAKVLIGAGADVTMRDEDGTTALSLASEQEGSLEIVRMLLRAGADPVCRMDWGQRVTPLHIAAANERPLVARELLVAGAQPSAVDARGMTSLHTAASLGHSAVLAEILKVLENAEEGPGQTEQAGGMAVRTLVTLPKKAVGKTGITFDPALLLAARDKQGKTALHYAAELLHLAAATALLRAGAVEHAKDAWGKRPSASVEWPRYFTTACCRRGALLRRRVWLGSSREGPRFAPGRGGGPRAGN